VRGIYGLVSYLVAQPTDDIGVRIAGGVSITNGFGQSTNSGVAIGLIAAFVLTRLMANMLFGIGAHDPLTFLAVAFSCVWLPCSRATFPGAGLEGRSHHRTTNNATCA